MKKVSILVVLVFGVFTMSAQTATNIANLQAPDLDETSGLLFYNSKLITHTDSGGEAELYEIDVSTGLVTRTVTVNSATNVDWEDITQDASFIYVGDIGNNNGNRTDLKIYKISKADYSDGDNMVTPEIIAYAYANQTDFTASPNNNNWDAEGLISYGDQLLLFTKNWLDNTVDVYAIPKTSGSQVAVLESSYNVNGLITGVDISDTESVIYLTGYSASEAPFLYTIHNLPNNSLDLFLGTVSEKISNIVPFGNQVEGITLFETTPTVHRLYISNEKFTASIGPITLDYPAKLWTIEIDASTITLNVQNSSSEFDFSMHPNPVKNILKLSKRVDEIVIYDLAGRPITKQHFLNEISLEGFNPGVYIAHIKIGNNKFVQKILKE